MNKAVEIIKLWGAYEEQHPEGTIEEFFRYQLSESLKEEKQIAPELQ